jgi:hypothetical protein
MQRTKEQLSRMSHEELVHRILEMQDILKEGLAVRDTLHTVLNNLLKAKSEEVEYFAAASEASLDNEGADQKKAWAAARHAVSNPQGLIMKQKQA